MLSNNKGFSLIELMVVVAIIAILSTIAIPSYQTFQAKARQKEGFALLGSYFSAAQATRVDLGFFPGNFVETGFSPVGTLSYELVAGVNAAYTMPYGQVTTAAMTACVTTATPAACPAGYAEWQNAAAVGVVGTTLGPIAPATASTANATTFLTHAASVISQKAAARDEYSIDQLKDLQMVTDGLK